MHDDVYLAGAGSASGGADGAAPHGVTRGARGVVLGAGHVIRSGGQRGHGRLLPAQVQLPVHSLHQVIKSSKCGLQLGQPRLLPAKLRHIPSACFRTAACVRHADAVCHSTYTCVTWSMLRVAAHYQRQPGRSVAVSDYASVSRSEVQVDNSSHEAFTVISLEVQDYPGEHPAQR